MVLTTLLVSIELIGHLSYKLYRGKFLFQNGKQENILFEEHPYLVGVPKKNFQLTNASGDVKISTDHLGRRVSYPEHMKHPEDATQIVCLGGSSTFGTGVTDADSWPYILQEKLGKGYCVTNLGVPGYSTLEAVIQLSTIVPEIEPDIIIMYEGWNDLKNYHLANIESTYSEHGMLQRTILKVNRKKSLADYSFIYFIAKKIKSGFHDRIKPKETYPFNDPRVDSLYAKNLRTMRTLGKHLNAKQIFVPQVLNLKWFSERRDIENLWSSNIPNEDMPELLKRFNQLMSTSVPTEKDIITIDSILFIRNWEDRHFVDEGHFSKAGGEVFTELLITAIKKLGKPKKDSLPQPASQ